TIAGGRLVPALFRCRIFSHPGVSARTEATSIVTFNLSRKPLSTLYTGFHHVQFRSGRRAAGISAKRRGGDHSAARTACAPRTLPRHRSAASHQGRIRSNRARSPFGPHRADPQTETFSGSGTYRHFSDR